jgi:hypothetical protein
MLFWLFRRHTGFNPVKTELRIMTSPGALQKGGCGEGGIVAQFLAQAEIYLCRKCHGPMWAVWKNGGRLRLKCDGTRAENRFRLSAKRTSTSQSAGTSVQSTTGSRGVRISGSNAGYTMFRASVKSTGYPLHSPVSPSLPLPVRHRVPSHFNWTLRSSTSFPLEIRYYCIRGTDAFPLLCA